MVSAKADWARRRHIRQLANWSPRKGGMSKKNERLPMIPLHRIGYAKEKDRFVFCEINSYQ